MSKFVTLLLILLQGLTFAKKASFAHIELFPNIKNYHYRIPSIVTSKNGTIIAFCNRRIGTVGDDASEVHLVYRTSDDNGNTWNPIEVLASKPGWCMTIESAVVDNENGNILIIYSASPNTKKAKELNKNENIKTGKLMAISNSNGKSWKFRQVNISPNSFNQFPNCHGAGTGITLKYSKKKGRLLIPARFAVKNKNGKSLLERDHFNCSIYSDDHGETWQTSAPLQPGTGEGCLVELLDGRIYYNSRAYHNDGKRRIGYSIDGGESYTNFSISNNHPECNGGTNAAMITIPSKDQKRQLILFSNPPMRTWKKHIDKNRKKMTVKISLDEAKTWPYKKRIFKGPSGYSSLTQANDGTILLLYEKGKKRYNDSGLSLTKFTIEKISDGKITGY